MTGSRAVRRPLRGRAGGWRARLRRTPAGALLLKALVFLAGLFFVALGGVAIVLPGPWTIPPILLGLGIWATEFAWAERHVRRLRRQAALAREAARRRPVATSVSAAGGLLVLIAVLWAVRRYELIAQAQQAVGL